MCCRRGGAEHSSVKMVWVITFNSMKCYDHWAARTIIVEEYSSQTIHHTSLTIGQYITLVLSVQTQLSDLYDFHNGSISVVTSPIARRASSKHKNDKDTSFSGNKLTKYIITREPDQDPMMGSLTCSS